MSREEIEDRLVSIQETIEMLESEIGTAKELSESGEYKVVY